MASDPSLGARGPEGILTGLLRLVDFIRRWDTHVMGCPDCVRFERTSACQPCDDGRDLIYGIIRILT